MAIEIKESELSPFFDSGQRKILRNLAQTILDGAVAQIVADPSVLNIELNDLADVVVPAPSNLDVLTFGSFDARWVGEASQGGVFTVVDNTDVGTVDASVDFQYTLQYMENTDSNVLIKIPPQSVEPWDDDAEFEIARGGTGVVAIEGVAGEEPVFIRKKAGTGIYPRYGKVNLKRLSENVWLMTGDIGNEP